MRSFFDRFKRTGAQVGKIAEPERSERERELARQLKQTRKRLAAREEQHAKRQARLKEKQKELAKLRNQLGQLQNDWHRADLSYDSAPVFFVIGQAKSGTSWLMRILDAHPEILCKGEGRFFGRDFKRKDLKEAENGRIQPASLYRALLEADYLRAWIERSVWTRGDDVEEHVTNLARLATHYFLTRKLARSGKKIVGDKTPLLSPKILTEINLIYSEAKVIHIIRDGRDAAVSLNYHRWNLAKDKGGIYNLDPEELERREAYHRISGQSTEPGQRLFTEKGLRGSAVSWKQQVGRVREDGRSLLGANYAEVKYEDLLERPEEEVGRLLEFLEADASDKVVRECVKLASFENWTNGRQRGQEDPFAFLRKGVAGDWKNFFTEEDKRIFKQEAGDLLIELGYERDCNW